MVRPKECCALVTGGSRGIGAATARALANDGWTVVVNYRENTAAADETVASIREQGGTAHAIQADVTNPGSLAIFDEIESKYGPVLGLVNNAGVSRDGLALQLDEDDWAHVLDTNLTATFRMTKRALKGMLRARFGRVINLASVVGPRANVGQANYAAAKAGVIGMTKTIAAEVARKNVTVNAVAPGLIATDMTAAISAAASDKLLSVVPARRVGTAEEVGAAICFLASDGAGYVNGTTLFVDGGLSA